MIANLVEYSVKILRSQRPGYLRHLPNFLPIDGANENLSDRGESKIYKINSDVLIMSCSISSQLQPLNIHIISPFQDL